MAKRLVLPQVPPVYTPEQERIRNREIEVVVRAQAEKIDELEARIKALEP